MTDVTNQDDVFEQDASENEVDGVADDQVNDQADQDAEQDGDEEGSQTDDLEEVEYGGKNFRIPKELKPALMLQADYTRKTQEAAEARRAFDEERSNWAKLSDEVIEAKAAERAIKTRAAELQALSEQDWHEIRQMDAQDGGDRYNRLMRELTLTPQKLAEAEQASKAKEAEALAQQSAAQTKLIEQGQAELQRDIPGWGPELGAKLASFVKSEFGIDEQRHSAAFMDPALVKLAHAAYQAKAAQRKDNTQARAAQADRVKPASQVKAGAAPKQGLHDGLSTDEWMKREREMQLRKRGVPAR